MVLRRRKRKPKRLVYCFLQSSLSDLSRQQKLERKERVAKAKKLRGEAAASKSNRTSTNSATSTGTTPAASTSTSPTPALTPDATSESSTSSSSESETSTCVDADSEESIPSEEETDKAEGAITQPKGEKWVTIKGQAPSSPATPSSDITS